MNAKEREEQLLHSLARIAHRVSAKPGNSGTPEAEGGTWPILVLGIR